MKIKKQELREALIDAFRTGQKAYQAPSYPMRIWAEEKIVELVSSNAEKTSLKHPQQTMNERYGDGSNHRSCGICGFCVDCGDCRSFGCTSDNWDDSQSKQITNRSEDGRS